MDVPMKDKSKNRTITGNFFYSQQKPISDDKSLTKNSEKRSSNLCELNCDDKCLSIYGSCQTRPILILPKITKVTRHKYDKEYFCLEYGEKPDIYTTFLTIIDKSDADDWEVELCKLTGQTLPPGRRRIQTGVKPRTWRNKGVGHTLSTPSVPDGFEESQRDGQSSPEESHIGEVVGYDKVSPTPGNTPSNRKSYAVDEEAGIVLEETNRKLHEMKGQQQGQHEQHQQHDQQVRQRHEGRQECPTQPFGELTSTHSLNVLQDYQCTHIGFECSQEKLSVAINKEEFLETADINNVFASYLGSLYVRSCPESLQSKLFIGTRILQVNKQEPVSADKAIDYILTSAVNTITDYGDGIMGKIAECKKCISTTLSASDHSSVERLSITAVGDRHVPYNAYGDEVKDMLASAINDVNMSEDGHLVLLLQPSEFCQAMAPNALQRRFVQEGDALLHPTPNRRPSHPGILRSIPPY
ncbi:uncharacterized protein LOC121424976 isoform X2 [Lytechinus variegatus]|uniref:uncharacterized protein LOC121424976 isoform X2 n=1 Tax=Lytechinus variegatus TaxID=7654 RepID=UPI001BB1F1C5|nr:uncharacterized protein LOC121424976 isoform X2 [Lytechinus variegatus]